MGIFDKLDLTRIALLACKRTLALHPAKALHVYDRCSGIQDVFRRYSISVPIKYYNILFCLFVIDNWIIDL